jgi:hypothetical protein
MPEQLKTPGKRVLYNNLNQNEELALKIDEPVRRLDPAIFVVIKQALLPLLGNGPGEVERIDPVVVPATGNRPTKVYRCCRPGTSCQAASLRVTDRVGPPN